MGTLAANDRPVGYQRWTDLLFLHWPMLPARVRPLVPGALELDLFEAHAWVTLIPFVIAESRPAGVPRALASRLLETNLRTYVRGPDGEPGIYFWSLEASSLAAVLAARLLYGLPYFPASMTLERDDQTIAYTSRRRVGGPASLDVAWTIGDPIGSALPGSRDHFLVERYSLYVMRRGRLYRARVRHRPYPLQCARVDRLSESLRRAAGLPEHGGQPLGHYSPGVDVEICWRFRVPER